MSLRARLRRRLRAEDGFSMIVAIAVLGLAILLGSAAMLESVSTNDTANRDRRVKRAIQAADAGVEAAVYRMNRLNVSGLATPCVTVDAAGVLNLAAPDAAGWCPPVTEDLGTGATYTYWVHQPEKVTGAQTTWDATVVSSGTVDGSTTHSVSRRVAAKASALVGSPLFGDSGLISLDDLYLPNNIGVKANSRSNGNITLANSSSIEGNAVPGPGKKVDLINSSTVSGSTAAATDQLVLAPVELGSADASNGEDARLDGCQTGAGLDTCSKKWVTWDGRSLGITNSGHVELGGNVYVFCSLSLSNSAVLTAAPKESGAVRIYIRAPEDPKCAGEPHGISMANNTEIVNQTTDPSRLQIYVLGASTITLANSNEGQYVVFAPDSTVNVANYVRIRGGIAARQVTMANHSQLTYDSRVADITTEAITPIYRRQQYRECSSVPSPNAPPDDGC